MNNTKLSVLAGYEPAALFTYFEELCAVPRPSGKEEAASDLIEAFAKEHGLSYIRDKEGSLLVRRPASPGRENDPPMLLQGHLDMVCEKNNDVVHDFMTEPLKLVVKDGMLRAEGTTLGGDDGIGVAAMMAALTEDISHPELECLFTVDEEVGMTGALSFDYSQIRSRRLINLDSEDEGVATISCAGGIRIHAERSAELVDQSEAGRTLTVSIKGLAGGHSGSDIGFCRTSALRLMGRLMSVLYEKRPFTVVSLCGGGKDNAIARECDLTLFTDDPTGVTEAVKAFADAIRPELSREDRKLTVRVSRAKTVKKGSRMLSFAETSRVISLLTLLPHGVMSTCPAARENVESSCNIGRAKVEDGLVTLDLLARSSLDTRLDTIVSDAKRIGKLTDTEITCHSRYPGWALVKDTPLQRAFLTEAKKLFGEKVPVRCEAIHAGLECGVFSSALPGLDAISIGPRLMDIHTPEETLDLASTQRFWRLLTALLTY